MLTLNAVVQTQMLLNAYVARIRQIVPENNKQIYKLVLADRKLKSREIAEELNI